MTPTWAIADRAITFKSVITKKNGQQITLNTGDITSFTANDNVSGSGLVLGGVSSVTYNMSFFNPEKAYKPSDFDGAEVHCFIGLVDEDADEQEWEDFGVWYVINADAPEQSTQISLSGGDALETRFNAIYEDGGVYPTTFGSLATAVCYAAGVTLKRNSFPNAAVSIATAPAWEEDIDLRGVISCIAACAGGFAHMTTDGELDIIGYAEGTAYTLSASRYKTFTLTGGTKFDFNCLEVKIGDDEDFRRFAIDDTIADDATNTLQVEDNPLMTESLANSIAAELSTIPALTACSLNWMGDPTLSPADRITVTDLHNRTHTLILLSRNWSLDGGLGESVSCTLPGVEDDGEGYSTAGSVFDRNGNVRATRVAGLDKSIVSATEGHFQHLTTETATIDTLLASYIDALKLRADSIDADEVTTDKLTAMMASIINATIRKLDAGTITTDEFYAKIAEIVALKVGSLTAGSITTDTLAAALAQFTVVTAGTATFDKATIQHLVASALNLEYGVADEVMIKNLKVDYASMVHASVGELCVKAENGEYYKLIVDENGNVSAELTSVTQEEIDDGMTEEGRTIIETEITASDLSASTIKGVYALINRLDASRIDTDYLTARTAFVDKLFTTNITGVGSLKVQIENLEDQVDETSGNIARTMTFDENGLTISAPNKVYSMVIDDTGYNVVKNDEGTVASFGADGVTTKAVKLGAIICKATTTGGWAWQYRGV